MAGETVLDEAAIRRRLRDDFQHYASRCLLIRPKSGDLEPFTLNQAQRHLHAIAEAQKERTGKVRLIVLKGRQQGCSTYIQGRFYHAVTHRRGQQAFILTHEQDASDRMFKMAQRFHDNCPEPVKPETGAANAKTLSFAALDSGYEVGTAGNKAVARSATIQFFHGSEAAYWRNAEDHASGALQTVPGGAGTEVWIESTSNGTGNWFYDQWCKAKAGETDFECVFIPWFWQTEYRAAVPAGFRRTDEEAGLATAHNLDDEQLAWRRVKIGEIGDEKFRREYPNDEEEAFRAIVDGAYYGSQIAAMRQDGRIAVVPHDPAFGVITAWDLGRGDETVIWFAQPIGAQVRIIDYYASSGVGLDHYAGVLRAKPYAYTEHILPHDIRVTDIGAEKSRLNTLYALGLNQIKVLGAIPIDDGIHAVRMLLPRCWFDGKKCAIGLEALGQYRREWSDNLRDFKPVPLHDWTSHAADAFRYLAVGIQPAEMARLPQDRDYDRAKRTRRTVGWMAA